MFAQSRRLIGVLARTKKIVICDPNILACPDWKDLLQQLIDSNARVDFNQGLDIRLITEEKAEMLKQIKVDAVHFAWDNYSDKDIVIPKFEQFKSITNWNYRKMTVYCLVNFNSTIEQDLERIYWLRDNGYSPFVMVYDKEHTTGKDTVRKLQRWVNNKFIFRSTQKFEEYTE